MKITSGAEVHRFTRDNVIRLRGFSGDSCKTGVDGDEGSSGRIILSSIRR